jgi:glutaminyl-tRNA synthetase
VLSKRKLLELVAKGYVTGWDDPRMPTLAGFRRRGFTPESIRALCDKVGVSKSNSTVDIAMLEDCLRDDLNKRAPRRMAVLRPLKVVLENYPEDKVEHFDIVNNPEDASAGTRSVPFSKVLYIEREDFMEDPPKKFFRLAPGREVRLRAAYLVTCTGVVKDDHGEVAELRCTVDFATRGGAAPDGRSPKATLHWASAAHAVDAEARLYDRLFKAENPDKYPEGQDYKANLNPESLVTLAGCKLEPELAPAEAGHIVQFDRQGYFCVDRDSRPGALVFNRAISLKDPWARMQKRQKGQ